MSELAARDTQVIARRLLRDEATHAHVELLVHTPAPDPDSDHGDWICKVEVVRDAASEVYNGYGVDSLQALVSGLVALRHGLKQTGMRNLVWLDRSGEVGLPLIVQEMDEDFLTLVESMISAEHGRQLVFRKIGRGAK